jgi:hypothetical protein
MNRFLVLPVSRSFTSSFRTFEIFVRILFGSPHIRYAKKSTSVGFVEIAFSWRTDLVRDIHPPWVLLSWPVLRGGKGARRAFRRAAIFDAIEIASRSASLYRWPHDAPSHPTSFARGKSRKDQRKDREASVNKRSL